MINFTRFTLENGLRVLLHPEPNKLSVAVNILYQAGTIYENPQHTGLAHLFEHLMFTGTSTVPLYDVPIQKAGGENNAFTCSDYATYYSYGPAENLSLLIAMEADRMRSLVLREKEIKIQKKVVIEEFYETCHDEPYGDMWHYFGEMLYPTSPYSIPVIGLNTDHIASADTTIIRDWYDFMYAPNNAILSITGRFDPQRIEEKIRHLFGDISANTSLPHSNTKDEQLIQKAIKRTVKSAVPSDALYLGFPIDSRVATGYYAADLWAEILGGGKSSRLYERLVNQEKLLFQIETYTNDVAGPGAFIIEGKCNKGVDIHLVEQIIWEELDKIKSETIEKFELDKATNKTLTTIEFSEYSTVNKAINLSFFEFLGDANLINSETDIYRAVTVEDLYRQANTIFQTSHAKTLFYLKNGRRKN